MEISSSKPTNLCTVKPENLPTLSSKQEITHQNPQTAAIHEPPSAAVLRLVGRERSRIRRKSHVKKVSADDKEEVEKKIVALQKIVPGGEKLQAEKLFEETAEYILELQCQVKALRFLAAIVEGSQKEKMMKLGG